MFGTAYLTATEYAAKIAERVAAVLPERIEPERQLTVGVEESGADSADLLQGFAGRPVDELRAAAIYKEDGSVEIFVEEWYGGEDVCAPDGNGAEVTVAPDGTIGEISDFGL